MRKIFAITMLAVYLFNLTGYPVLFHFLIGRSSGELVTQLDENRYDESALLEIKVPLHSQYIINNDRYERYEGQAEVNGIRYTYVKRKVSHDTLYIKYIPDSKSTQLIAGQQHYGKQANDFPSEKNGQSISAKKANANIQYHDPETIFSFAILPVISVHALYPTSALPDLHRGTMEQPPDAIVVAG